MVVSSETAISCKNLKKSFGHDEGQVMALRGVDLEVKSGELLMLVGPSGCGKTTLISVIAGILNTDSGSIHVLGKDYATMSDGELTSFRAQSIGFVFQAYNLIPTLTVEENVAIPWLLNGGKFDKSLSLAREALRSVGIEDKARQHPDQLSGGQQQRVAIARALVHQPKILVADEPTSALDHENGVTVMKLFRQVALAHSRTLIIVTHDSRMYEFADRIAVMEDGIIVEVR